MWNDESGALTAGKAEANRIERREELTTNRKVGNQPGLDLDQGTATLASCG